MLLGSERARVVMIEIKAGLLGFLGGVAVFGGLAVATRIGRPAVPTPTAVNHSLHSQWPSKAR
jgi:hypothetical protein